VDTSGEQTRADLLSSARDVFGRYGYHGTNIARVAQQAGVTRPAVHYHFRSKHMLYRQVTEACYRLVVAPAVEAAVDQRTLAQQVSTYIDVAGRAVAHEQSVAAFLCTSAAECATWPELRDPEHDPVTTIRAFLTRAVRAAEQRGELCADVDVEPLIEMLVAMLCSVWLYVGFLGDPEEERAITSRMDQLLTAGLGL
jgi:AcrR family transcriptional regulator